MRRFFAHRAQGVVMYILGCWRLNMNWVVGRNAFHLLGDVCFRHSGPRKTRNVLNVPSDQPTLCRRNPLPKGSIRAIGSTLPPGAPAVQATHPGAKSGAWAQSLRSCFRQRVVPTGPNRPDCAFRQVDRGLCRLGPPGPLPVQATRPGARPRTEATRPFEGKDVRRAGQAVTRKGRATEWEPLVSFSSVQRQGRSKVLAGRLILG